MTTTPPEAPVGPPGDAPPRPPGGADALPPQGSPEPGPPDPQRPRATRDEVRDLRTLRRTVGPHRYLAGVSGGVARHLDIDPVIVRVLFVVLTFFGGVGLFLYVAFWLVLPADGAPKAIFNLDQRSLTFAVVGVLGLASFLLIGGPWGGFGFPWPLTLLGIIVAAVLLSRDGRRNAEPAPSGYGHPAPMRPSADQPSSPPARAFGDQAQSLAPRGADPSYPTQAYPVQGPPPGMPWPTAPRPPKAAKPRKKGPILFWFTLALMALALGTLGIIDLAGVAVAASAYPALALGVSGVMLLVGAFYGRAGGVIALGLLLVPILSVTTAVENLVDEDVTYAPTTAADVETGYSMDSGGLTLDLSGVTDPERLDGKTIDVDGDFGQIHVILPTGVDSTVDAQLRGFGEVSGLGRSSAGIEPALSFTHDVQAEAGSIDINVDLGVGEVIVTTNERSYP